VPPTPSPPTAEQEAQAIRELIADPNEPEEMKVIWRKKLVQMKAQLGDF